MPDIAFTFPHVIAVENLQTDRLSKDPVLVQQLLSLNFQGVVTKEGMWAKDRTGNILCPGGDWKIEKSDIGVYKISHNLGYTNTSVNVSLFQSPGSIQVVEHNIYFFVVATTLNGTPTDMPFCFSSTQTISP